MKKRVLSLILTVMTALLVLSLPAAQAEINAAETYALIPDCLRDADLAAPITAAEFSALAVRLFEEIWQTQELREKTPYANIVGHPLQSDIEKAYGLGFLNPIQAESFHPDAGFARQVLAMMYCNLVKACEFDGCTQETVDSFFLPYIVSGHFADEADIAPAALDSVFYMTANGLMDVSADGKFSPLASATREEAIVTAYRIFNMEAADESSDW